MGRQPLIAGTEWQEPIERMMADGWSSGAISRFMWARFKYALDDSTIRRYRSEKRAEIEKRYPELAARAAVKVFKEALLDRDEFVDVMGSLAWLGCW